jgi:hypothetical protein
MQEQLQLPGFSRQKSRKLIIQLVDIWYLKYIKSKKIITTMMKSYTLAYLFITPSLRPRITQKIHLKHIGR